MNKLELKSISYRYPRAKRMILKDVCVSFEPGKLYSVEGESGAGKSTLLTILAGLSRPVSGEILADGEPIRNRTEYRRNTAAAVAQDNLLFDGRTILENVMYPLLLKGVAPDEAEERAYAYLAEVKLDRELGGHFPRECSGGEQKRAAFARAMALENPVFLADEPTANLDKGTAAVIADLLENIAHDKGRLVIAVTHDDVIPARADKRFFLRAGVLEE